MMKRCQFAALSVLGALVLVAAPRPKPRYDATFYSPSEAVVSPHTPWANPLAGGPLRVLFLTHRNAMREVVELTQRLEMEYTVFAQESSAKFGETGLGVDASWRAIEGNSAEELAADLRAKLAKRHELIVLGNIDWNTLPLDCRYLILRQVKEGAGLVGRVHGGSDEHLARLVGDTDFPWRTHTWSGAAKDVPDYFGVGEFAYAVDTEQAHGGRASVRVSCTKAAKGSRETPRGGYMPGTLPPLEPDTEYVFSVWSRTEGMAKGGAVVSLYPQGDRALPVGSEWSRTEIAFRTDAKKLGIGVYLLAYQPGTVWFDDVSLTKRGDSRNLLPNPGFEPPPPVPGTVRAGVPDAALPKVAIATFGEGRIGLLTSAVPTSQMLTLGARGDAWDTRQDYDYHLAAAVKLMLWGARREQPARFPDAPVAFGRGGGIPPVQAHLPGASRAALRVRNRDGRIFAERELPVADGSIRIDGLLAGLPRGEFLADVRGLDAEGRVVGFGSVAVAVTAPDGIGEVVLEPSAIASGAPLRGRIAIEGAPRGTLDLRAVDYHGRWVAHAVLPAASTVAFSLAMPEALALCGHLQVDLRDGDTLLDTAVVRYTITDRRPDPANVQFVMWQSYGNDFLAPLIAEQFTRCGIDSQYGGSGRAQKGPRANQWWLPYATRFIDTKTDWYQPKATREQGDLVRSPCLTDPEYRAKVRESLRQTAQAAREVGTAEFTLGDENHFVAGRWDLCFSETCVADFRRWAATSYGTLAALNNSWGSDFASWVEVRPRTLDECRKDGNYVPWIDHRLHMESVWADIHAFARDVIRETVPDARVGYEGSDVHVGVWHAADFWKLSRAMDLNNIYYRDFVSQAWADFAQPGTLLGAGWFGGYASNRNDVFMRYFPWRAIFKGGNSLWVWAGHGHAGAVMSFDTSLYPFFATACAQVAELKSGPGKLLLTAERCHDGVALLYSAASVDVAEIIPGAPRPEDVLNAWVRILNDVGIACRVVSYEQLAEGRVKAGADGFRTLVLPCAWALSPAECAAVEAFAATGGSVVADLLPARTDGHGKPYAAPPLAGLFGVAPQGAFARKATTLDGVNGVGDGSVTGMRLGEGRAVLLNFSLDGYVRLPKPADTDFAGWEEGAAYRQLVASVLASAGVVPPVTIAPEAPRVEISRFRRGDCEYLAVLQALPREALDYTLGLAPPPTGRRVAIRLPRQAHLYDVRAGKSLGRADRIETELVPGIARLFALLPGRISRVGIQVPSRVHVGETARMSTEISPRGPLVDRVLRIEVADPGGAVRPYYGRTLLAAAGRAEFAVPFALNDPPGTWRLTVRDVASGETGSERLRLIPRD